MAEPTEAPELVKAPVEDAPAPPRPGWYRNRGAVELLVQPHNYPSARLAPGASTWLPDDPQHRDIETCDEPPPAAADTSGSEK